MKRNLSIIVASLAALVASMALASVAAAAPPEWGQCNKAAVAHTGEYLGKGCTTSAGGKGAYNWTPEPAFNSTFEGTGEEITLETTGKHKITCAASTYLGSFTGPKTATVTIDLIGCNTVTGGVKQECQSSPIPQKESEIEAEYEAELGFIKAGERPQVGVDLKPKSTILFTCGKLAPPPELGPSGEITGSVIGRITPINHGVTEFKLIHKETAGKQLVQNFEGAPKDTLTVKWMEGLTSTEEEAGLRMKSTLETVEPVEIRTKS